MKVTRTKIKNNAYETNPIHRGSFHGPDELNMNAQGKMIEEQNINNKTILMKFTKMGALLGPIRWSLKRWPAHFHG